MSANSKIEWTDHTFNPWIGCTKVSPGCANCYAESYDKRTSGGKHWGKGAPRRRTTADYWKQAKRWNDDILEVEFTKPRVFPSLCDWLDPEVPIEWLADFLQLIHGTPNLDWLLLTKRPELLRERVLEAWPLLSTEEGRGAIGAWAWRTRDPIPLPNVWLGTSVEDQKRADERIPILLQTPAAIRFLSCEPLLGRLHLTTATFPSEKSFRRNIHWVIAGGESGPKARPCEVAWIRSIVNQCRNADVPVFVKQLGQNIVDRNDAGFEGDDGEWPMDTNYRELDSGYQGAPVRILLNERKGGVLGEWPEDLRVREFPDRDVAAMTA